MDDVPTTGPTLAVLMTCHDRRESTLACLDALARQEGHTAAVTVFLTDDGSTDGTAEAVTARFPSVIVVPGDGSLFWAAGMAAAERVAMDGEPDYLLWLNDDVLLDSDALARLLTASTEAGGALVVGAMRDPSDGRDTYGGRRRDGRHPMRLTPVPSSPSPQPIDTFNGNCVLVPRAVRRRVGPIDGEFAHAFADDDYGLRAGRLGIRMVQAPGTVGRCPRHDQAGHVRSLADAWAFAQSPKGAPWRSQARFLRRHGGAEWPLLLAWSQARFTARARRGDV
jgi:GT2 family glycosyltransferase